MEVLTVLKPSQSKGTNDLLSPFSDLPGLLIKQATMADDVIALEVRAEVVRALCPLCSQPSAAFQAAIGGRQRYAVSWTSGPTLAGAAVLFPQSLLWQERLCRTVS